MRPCFVSQVIWATSLALGLTHVQVQAQPVIHMVVPFGSGAVQDTIARAFSTELGQALGATIVVENRAGAGGTVGTAYVAKAPADGRTLVLAAASHHLTGHLYSTLPYHPHKDFVGVSMIGQAAYVLAAPSNVGVNSFADYVQKLKAQNGSFNYASAGNGSATHLGMASFLARVGATMQHIPMKSTGDAVNEVLAGRVQGVMSAPTAVMGLRNDPKIKLLAFTGLKRSQFLPELPTVAELGYPGFKYDSWVGILAPANTPKEEVERINAAFQKVVSVPAMQERLLKIGIELSTLTPAAFQKLLATEWESAGAIVKASGAKIE